MVKFVDSEVKYIEHMGSDLSVVNAARVSFDKESEWEMRLEDFGNGEVYRRKVLSAKDANLIQFLARGMSAADFDKFCDDIEYLGRDVLLSETQQESNDAFAKLKEMLWKWRNTPLHWAPFAHPHITFKLKVPIFVDRQLVKHQIGAVRSEVSRRYVDSEPEFYNPESWRKKAANVKQGSSDEIVGLPSMDIGYADDIIGKQTIIADDIIEICLKYYMLMIQGGVCPEQARMVLPLSMMTEYRLTGSLYYFANMCKQRLDSHTQKETRDVAQMISNEMEKLFPVSWGALLNV
jgi:thymidylate synthase (FAD)